MYRSCVLRMEGDRKIHEILTAYRSIVMSGRKPVDPESEAMAKCFGVG